MNGLKKGLDLIVEFMNLLQAQIKVGKIQNLMLFIPVAQQFVTDATSLKVVLNKNFLFSVVPALLNTGWDPMKPSRDAFTALKASIYGLG